MSDSTTLPEPGTTIVPYLSIEVEDGLPATPEGLLNIARVFERQGYQRLSRYLRACADQMMAIATAPPAVAAAVSRLGPAHAGGPFEVLAVIGGDDHPRTSEILLRSRDDVLHSLPVGALVELLPAAPTKAEG